MILLTLPANIQCAWARLLHNHLQIYDFFVKALSRAKFRAGQVGQVGREGSTSYRLWQHVFWLFPEVIDLAVGMGAEL